MAKIAAMPDRTTIDGLKGTLDFYVHRGIPCVRSWPRWQLKVRSPAVQATAANFAAVASVLKLACPEVIAAAKWMATGTLLTWKDVYTSILLGGTYLE
jgi:hypothetical protein